MYVANSAYKTPTALDVYRGKTELVIDKTYRNDIIVRFKKEFNK